MSKRKVRSCCLPPTFWLMVTLRSLSSQTTTCGVCVLTSWALTGLRSSALNVWQGLSGVRAGGACQG